jgi:hypothetical protein
MPKLNQKTAKAAEGAAEDGGPGPMPEGRYICRLLEVNAKDASAPDKAPYWSWQYAVNEEGDFFDRKLWDNTSLSEAAQWRLGAVFAAFEVPADTDTDELIGREVAIIVGQETAQRGKMLGKLVNVVNRIEALTDEEKDYQAVGTCLDSPEI